MDTLRVPRKRDQKLWEWRRTSPIRPVVFKGPPRWGCTGAGAAWTCPARNERFFLNRVVLEEACRAGEPVLGKPDPACKPTMQEQIDLCAGYPTNGFLYAKYLPSVPTVPPVHPPEPPPVAPGGTPPQQPSPASWLRADAEPVRDLSSGSCAALTGRAEAL